MNTHLQTQTKAAPTPSLASVPTGLLQRTCACGGTPGLTGECGECSKNKLSLQRRIIPSLHRGESRSEETISPIVHEVLRSPGQPLDAAARAFFEPRFGHDFSRVRIHTDTRAAESAQAVNALAYTVSPHIVFQAAHYTPGTDAGKKLLAHELAHVVQQQGQPGVLSEFTLDAANSPAEAEADTVAEAVMNREPVPQAKTASPGSTIHRKLEGGVIGGIALGILGGLFGGIVGGLIGIGLGATFGHFLTKGKKADSKSPPYERIKKLLSRGIFDWAVTDEDARAVMKILLDLKPKEMLETIVKMKNSGAWNTLKRELPESDPIGFDYFAEKPLNRTTGYIMPGDRINLDIYVGGKLERRASGEYTVHEDGVHLDDNKNEYLLPEFRGELKEPIQIAEMKPEEAINTIAKFFIDHLIYPGGRFWLNVTRRGHLWGPDAGATGGIAVESTYSRPDTVESRLRDKRSRFAEYAARYGTDKYVHRILAFYWHEVDNNLDKWQTPEDLWAWAAGQASKPLPESPIEPFYSFYLALRKQLDFVSTVNKGTWQDAMDRYAKWLDAHINDPDLGKYKPEDIWKKAIRNALTVEAKRFREEFLRKEKERREHPAIDWEAAGKKLDQALEFIKRKIYYTPEPQYIEAKSEGVSYLVGASDAEKLVRQRIGDDFLHDIVSRMGDPNFLQTSVEDDFAYYLSKNWELKQALELTQAHPYVEKAALEREEIPGWQTAIEVVVGFIPVVGQVVGAYEAISGKDLFGNPLSNAERAILGASILLPASAKIYKGGKALYTVDEFTKLYRNMSAAEADALFRATAGIKPGSFGARLLGEVTDTIKNNKAGTVFKDPEKLKKVGRLLDDMGLTEQKTARALSKRPGSILEGVEKQADEIAEKEINNIGAITEGALNDDTVKLLKQQPALRSALAENGLAARALKKCNTPCYPPNATADQIRTLEQHLERIKATGKYNENNLREFLYQNRDNLDKAIGDVMKHKTSRHMDEFLRYEIQTTYYGPVRRVPPREDPRMRGAMVERSHDIGVMHGRAYAGEKLGLKGTGFKNPFEKSGKYGQGFDDIMVLGDDLETGIIYIVEYKGGGAVLEAGQMELEWVAGNIRRLFTEGGTAGQDLARKLSKALREGRLKGVALSTPIESGIAQETKELASWIYDAKKLSSSLGI
jgi:hypothetical protein